MREFAKAAAIAADAIEDNARRREKEALFRANHEPVDETACESDDSCDCESDDSCGKE